MIYSNLVAKNESFSLIIFTNCHIFGLELSWSPLKLKMSRNLKVQTDSLEIAFSCNSSNLS